MPGRQTWKARRPRVLLDFGKDAWAEASTEKVADVEFHCNE